MSNVLLVEDDTDIAEPLARTLRREGYEVEVAHDGLAALEPRAMVPDIVILDLGLPKLDGLEVCRRMRAGGLTAPVMILTARAEEVDTVVGLDAGADDYVTKPFKMAELLARMRALLRRAGREGGAEEEGSVHVDADARRAFLNGQELQLTAKEFDLLRVLVREKGKVISREDLMREVWDSAWYGSTKTLDMHISVLRKKLGDDAMRPRHIITVRSVGFRFEDNPAS